MATENVSKTLPFVLIGTPTGDVSVTKLVMYAIVNTDTPPTPPPANRRMRVSANVGRILTGGAL